MSRAAIAALLAIPALLTGCGLDAPGVPDGSGTIVVTVVDTSGFLPGSVRGEPFRLDSAVVSIESRSHKFDAIAMSDADGVASFEKLAAGEYSVFARREIVLGSAKKVFTGSYKALVSGPETASNTLNVKLISASQLMINEIFYAGSCAATFYMYDVFVELYNASPDPMYLDGIILMRAYNSVDPEMENVDYVQGSFSFQFPGTPVTGRQYPILPGQCLVVAADATNHTQFCPNSVDLRTADWETFNALSNDFDNPSVPNLNNIVPGRTQDLLINLAHNGIIISTGEEYTITSDLRVQVPIGMVIDGVEYSVNSDAAKQITVRVDAGYAGVGLTRYSAQTIERRERGLDTNDSTFDFTILPRPTPGWFHGD